MKKFLLTLSLFIFSFSSMAYTLEEIAGTYVITNAHFPTQTIIEIDSEGNVSLTDQSLYGDLQCYGYATVERGLLKSEVLCENDLEFVQKVDLTEVENINEFTANVYSSLFGVTIAMDFKKIK